VFQLRYAIRGFVRRPAFTAALIVSVAIGIGGNAVVLGFMNGLVSRPAPLPAGSGTAVTILAQHGDGGLGLLSVTQFESIAQRIGLFDRTAAVLETRNAVRLDARSFTAAVATISPAAVRFFGLPEGDGVVLSADFAARELPVKGPRPGQTIGIDGRDYPIAGIASRELDGLYLGRPVDIWRVGAFARAEVPVVSVVAHLRPGVPLRRAQREVSQAIDSPARLIVAPYTGLAPDTQAAMNRLQRLMPAIAGAVFFIGCANVGVLLLSRAARESRDTAVRMALGATRATLAYGALSSAAMIAAVGALAGLLAAVWMSDIIPALLFAPDAERLAFATDARGIVISTVASAVLVAVCGAAAILENRRDTPARVLSREADRPSGPLGTLRRVMVVLQMATCCILVIAAATVSEALSASLRTAAGQRLGTTILVTVASRYDYRRQDLGLQYFRTLEKTLREEPGISSAAWTAGLPGNRPASHAMTVEPPALPARRLAATVDVFRPDDLDKVELPPAAGRMFGGIDTRSTCRVAVVSEGAAEALYGGDAVGRLLRDAAGHAIEIIGVARAKPKRVRAGAPVPDVYYYAEQASLPFTKRDESFDVSVVPTKTTAILDVRVVTPGYFEFIGLPAVAGRLLDDGPPPDACRIGVLNEAAAQLFFGGSAVGGAVIDASGRRTSIVGVVRDASVRATHRRPAPALYVPLEQDFTPRMNLLLASTDTSDELQARLLRRARAVAGGDESALIVMRLEDRLRQTALAAERIAELLLSVASVNALALAIIGLYRITADDVLERQREMAVRSALGAQGWRLVALVARRAGRVAAFGILAGLLGAVLYVRWLRSVTGLDTTALDWMWIAGPLVIAVATLVASWLPAKRILKLDPLVAMRTE
jgi:ABC-type lipoprotein release transport system permease subunit